MQDRPYQQLYLDALNAAHCNLDQISQELTRLSTRKQLLQTAVKALASVINQGNSSDESLEEVAGDSLEHGSVTAISNPHSSDHVSAPTPSEFTRGSDSAEEAMQRRIDYALGRAVA